MFRYIFVLWTKSGYLIGQLSFEKLKVTCSFILPSFSRELQVWVILLPISGEIWGQSYGPACFIGVGQGQGLILVPVSRGVC